MASMHYAHNEIHASEITLLLITSSSQPSCMTTHNRDLFSTLLIILLRYVWLISLAFCECLWSRYASNWLLHKRVIIWGTVANRLLQNCHHGVQSAASKVCLSKCDQPATLEVCHLHHYLQSAASELCHNQPGLQQVRLAFLNATQSPQQTDLKAKDLPNK